MRAKVLDAVHRKRLFWNSPQSRFLILVLATVMVCSCERTPRQYQGYVEGEDIYLASPIAGKLVKICVQRGQKVRKGQLLFQLDPEPQTMLIKEAKSAYTQGEHLVQDLKQPKRPAEIDAIKAQIAQADAQLQLAILRVKRNQTLYDKRVLDKDSLDASVERQKELTNLKAQFESNLTLALEGARPEQISAQESQLYSLGIKIQQAQWELDQKTMYAPDKGSIFDVYFRRGEFVTAQRPVLSLLTPRNTRIEFFVPLEDLAKIYVGKKIQFSCENCSKENQAVISYVSPEAEYAPPLVYSRENSDKLVFRIKARAEHADRIMPGQPVIVRVSDDHG
jgi:HlyD family secretion protein